MDLEVNPDRKMVTGYAPTTRFSCCSYCHELWRCASVRRPSHDIVDAVERTRWVVRVGCPGKEPSGPARLIDRRGTQLIDNARLVGR